MVTEIADITVTPGSADQFAAAFHRGAVHLAGAAGFRGARLTRSVESPERFVLLVEWDTLTDHTEGFRSSPAFQSWRAEVGGFFAGPPTVEHLREVAHTTAPG